ncbi:MAG: carboxypeptidase-like regulatory domain-containing protein [Planctomycetota bacterium]
MKPRDLIVCIATLGALALAIVLLSQAGGETTESGPDGSGGAENASIAGGPSGDSAERSTEMTRPTVSFQERTGDEGQRETTPSQSPPTAGIIDGKIVLASGLPQPVSTFTIVFQESINPNAQARDPTRQPRAWTKAFKADPGVSPLYFTATEVPFSEFGYRVSVFVPGVNGSSQFTRCDESSPINEVTLSLTPPSPFSLRLIDQYRNPVADKEVRLEPDGEPLGRSYATARSDSFGVAIFTDLLAGPWHVKVEDLVRGRLEVQPPGVVSDDAGVGVQSSVIVVPRGKNLRIEAFDLAGHGLVDVELQLVAVDTVENRRLEARTDETGTWTFDNVPVGRWQLNAQGGGHYAPISRTVTIAEDRDPEPVRIRLARVR